MSIPRPETFDPWSFVQFCLENGDRLYVRIPWPDPDTQAMVPTLIPLVDLDPPTWIYWVRQWYHIERAPVMSLQDWIDREAREASQAGFDESPAPSASAPPSTPQRTNTNPPASPSRRKPAKRAS